MVERKILDLVAKMVDLLAVSREQKKVAWWGSSSVDSMAVRLEWTLAAATAFWSVYL